MLLLTLGRLRMVANYGRRVLPEESLKLEACPETYMEYGKPLKTRRIEFGDAEHRNGL